MHSSLLFSRRLFPPGFNAEYSFTKDFSAPDLSKLIDAVLNHAIDFPIAAGTALTDIKGRDESELIFEDIPVDTRPRGHELLYLGGKLISSDGPESFSARVLTPFDSFAGNHHIVHRVEEKRSSSLPADIDFQSLARMFPASIDRFRLGIEIFHSRFISGILGFAPNVTRTLLVDATPATLGIKVIADEIRSKKKASPLTDETPIRRFCECVQQALDIDLPGDYQAKLNER